MNRSSDVNVVHEGSPSRMRRVRLISFGITILPKSSTLLTIPVAVPDICLRRRCSLASVDRCHSLCSLFLPQAAVASLPSCFHLSFSFTRRGGVPARGTGNPSPTIILQITLLVSVKGRRLYRKIYFFNFLCYNPFL